MFVCVAFAINSLCAGVALHTAFILWRESQRGAVLKRGLGRAARARSSQVALPKSLAHWQARQPMPTQGPALGQRVPNEPRS